MKVCVPIESDGSIGERWGKAQRVAVAEVDGGEIRDWQEFDVQWGTLHDQGSEGSHHARIATFLRENGVELVAVHHVGPGMHRMLDTMGIRLVSEQSGDARATVVRLT